MSFIGRNKHKDGYFKNMVRNLMSLKFLKTNFRMCPNNFNILQESIRIIELCPIAPI